MAVYLATKTIKAINDAIKADQGAQFRQLSQQVLPHIADAYRADEEPFRTHLGASGVGNECPRAIWYSFRWSTRNQFEGQLLRLFNRGHLEEGRFIAMLLMIGCEVFQQDENGKQFKISDAGGHFGGSGDGIILNVPDVPEGTPLLGEFKTSNDKNFIKLKKEGVRASKFEHYVQTNIYMRKMGLGGALYLVVNKNTDELYGEIVPLDTIVADQFIERGCQLVFLNEPPKRISNSPGWYQCSWCDHKPICHLKKEPDHNCRTCFHSYPHEDGTWRCREINKPEHVILKKETQFIGCKLWLKDDCYLQ